MSRAKLRRYFRHGLLPQLIVFEAVARLGSVTRAAEELHLAQPTVSMQLKKLAETLEVALFEQRGRRLHLTGAGQELRATCAELMQCFARAEEQLAAWRKPKQERLRLAAEPEARAVAARLLARSARATPACRAACISASEPSCSRASPRAPTTSTCSRSRSTACPTSSAGASRMPRGRPLPDAAALFFREALRLDAGGPAAKNASTSEPEEKGQEQAQWRSPATTTPQ